MRTACLIARVAAAIAFLAPPASGAPAKEFRSLVLAENLSVPVLRGGQTVIELRGVEGNNNPLRYSIVEGPRHGRLDSLQQGDPNRQGRGFVRYEHGNDEESRSDSFRYKVTAPISGRSAVGTVTVSIAEPAPVLGTARALTFSAVVGDRASASLSLTNIGGGTLRGLVRAEPPFFVDGDGAFELKRNRNKEVRLRFEPRSAGLFGPVKIRPTKEDPTAFVTLRGEATPPFAVRTSSGAFQLKADDSRTAVVELVNLSEHPQTIGVSARPEGLIESVGPVELAAKQTKEIALSVPPARKGPGESLDLVFSAQAHREQRRFEIPPVPARIEVLTPQVDFAAGREAVLKIRNSGGVEGGFFVALPPGIDLADHTGTASVPPGSDAEVRLIWSVPDGAPAPTELLVRTAAAEPERVAILAAPPEPAATPAAPRQGEHPAPAEIAEQTPPAPGATPAEEKPKPSWYASQPKQRTSLYSVSLEPGEGACSLRLAIPSDPTVEAYRLERLKVTIPIDPETKRPGEAVFEPLPHDGKIEIATIGKENQPGGEATVLRATISGLPPGSVTSWRLVPVAGGSDLAPTREFGVTTRPPVPVVTWQMVWLAVGAFCLAVLGWWMWRARRAGG